VVKPARVGGLRQAHAIIERATTASVPVTVSTLFETGVGLAGALHLAATAPGRQAHGLATAELLESDLLRTSLPITDGRMSVPAGPGLGVDLDPVALERYRVR
jgi:L-alanine-DL-glutamate epimerase-like enolase superfamily enzyme